MIDRRDLMLAKDNKMCFICAHCEKFYEGVDRQLRFPNGLYRCTSVSGCSSPMEGGTFHEYKGPLSDCKRHFCYVCGQQSPEYILAQSSDTANGIGCCKSCFERMTKKGKEGDDGITLMDELRSPSDPIRVKK